MPKSEKDKEREMLNLFVTLLGNTKIAIADMDVWLKKVKDPADSLTREQKADLVFEMTVLNAKLQHDTALASIPQLESTLNDMNDMLDDMDEEEDLEQEPDSSGVTVEESPE